MPQTKMYWFASLLLVGTWMASCDKDGDPDLQTPAAEDAMELTALQVSDETEWISEEVLSMAEEAYSQEELSATGKGVPSSGFLPECVTITTIRTGGAVSKTVDFGQGCQTPNGNTVTGILSLRFSADFDAMSNSLSLELSDFTFNGIAVEGEAEVLRMRSNESGNPHSEVTSSFRAEWPDGETATWEGSRSREWIEGYGSGFWADNVFLITGSQTLVRRSGTRWSRTVVEPLKREMACRFLVSGLLEIRRNEQSAMLDFGDGSCDAFGELTYPDGSTETLALRRLRP